MEDTPHGRGAVGSDIEVQGKICRRRDGFVDMGGDFKFDTER